MNDVIIFTGPVGSGKTTTLNKFITGKNCDGIIAPVMEGKRYIQRIKTGEIKLLDTESKNAVQIGNHKFSKEVFEWSKKQIQESIKNKIEFLVIDEIGKLELNGKGYEPALSEVINHFKEQNYFKLVLVIRDSLADKVLEKYSLSNFKIDLH